VGVHLSSISFDQTDRPVSYRLADYLSDAYGRTCPDMESRLFFLSGFFTYPEGNKYAL
jgi:hypothetical protein